MDIKITKTAHPKEKPDQKALGFGKYMSDHMFLMDYTEGIGWHDARIVPYAPIPMDPGAVALHYAQETFEGLKAYRTAEGKIQLFRPEMNARRMINSNRRLCMPPFPEDMFIEAVKAIVTVDADWVPSAPALRCTFVPSCSPPSASSPCTTPRSSSSASSAPPRARTMKRASTR